MNILYLIKGSPTPSRPRPQGIRGRTAAPAKSRLRKSHEPQLDPIGTHWNIWLIMVHNG